MKKKVLNLEIIFFITILIFIIIIITNVCLVMKNNVRSIKNKQEALGLASSIIENIKSRKYDDIKVYLKDLSAMGINKKIDENTQDVVVNGKEYKEMFFGVNIPDNYSVEVVIDNTTFVFDVVKNVTVKVIYENNKDISITTNIQRETIEECNRPILTNQYIENLKFNLTDVNIFPIRYDDINKTYIVCNEKDNNWYNYSAKKWAKVIIFNKKDENIQKAFIDSINNEVKESINYNNKELKIVDYMYVWIPNFSIKDNISYFRYESSKNIITSGVLYNGEKYLYLNKILDEVKDISTTCTFDGISGVWKKYGDNEDEYYKYFNMTRFAPINIY